MCGSVPSEQEADEAGFAGPRGPDHGHVLAGREVEIDPVEDGAPGGDDAQVAHLHRGRAARSERARAVELGHLLDGAERLEEAQRGVSQGGVAARGRGDLLAVSGQRERPVEQQQGAREGSAARWR